MYIKETEISPMLWLEKHLCGRIISIIEDALTYWHLPPILYFHFTPYQKRALAVFSATPFCLRKYFSWKGVHRTYKLYYAMLKIIKMIMLCNNVLSNTMHSLFSCKCKYLLFSSFEICFRFLLSLGKNIAELLLL